MARCRRRFGRDRIRDLSFSKLLLTGDHSRPETRGRCRVGIHLLIRCRRKRRAPSLPAVVEPAAPVRATSLRDTLAVPAMIANLGNHASRRLLEVLRWIAAGEWGSSSRSSLICIWYAIHGERRQNSTAHPQHVRGGPMVRSLLPPAGSQVRTRHRGSAINVRCLWNAAVRKQYRTRWPA